MGKKKEHEEKPKDQPQEPRPEEILMDDLKRVQADFENYRKRIERDREQYQQLATEKLLKEIVPILDHFTLAIEHANADPKELMTGVAMIRSQLQDVLEGHGVEQVPTDIPFDPRLHEAITTTSDPNTPTNTITRVHQRGYALAGKVLQPAKVTINKVSG